MTTSKKTEVSAVAAAIAKAEAKAKREALEVHMARDIRAVKLDAGCTTQYCFHATRKWRFDFAWPQRKVALEVDGGVHTGGRHTRGAGFTEDCEKVNAAVILGWRVLRVTGEHVKGGEAIQWVESLLRPKPVVLAALDEVEAGRLAHEKEKPVRSPTYLARVRKLPRCARCGREDRGNEAAHRNRGKGTGIKAGDNYSMPLCREDTSGTDPVRGCHWLFDNYKLGTPEEQDQMCQPWILSTYDTLKRQGLVPMNVPRPTFKGGDQ